MIMRIPRPTTKMVDRYVIVVSVLLPIVVTVLLIVQINSWHGQHDKSCGLSRGANTDLIHIAQTLNAQRDPGDPNAKGAIAAFEAGVEERYQTCLRAG